MTQRSILAGQLPIVIRAGADVEVTGWDNDRVQAESIGPWGLKLERRSETEIGRIRARVGDFTLLDVGIDKDILGGLRNTASKQVTEVQLGGHGKVQVPFESQVKIYAGHNVSAHDLRGNVAVYAGGNVRLHQVRTLGHASAGGALDLDCEQLGAGDLKFTAGRDVRFAVRTLPEIRLIVHDLGDRWEAMVGGAADNGENPRRAKGLIKAGGDFTIVPDQELIPQSPYFILGNVEKPGNAGG